MEGVQEQEGGLLLYQLTPISTGLCLQGPPESSLSRSLSAVAEAFLFIEDPKCLFLGCD